MKNFVWLILFFIFYLPFFSHSQSDDVLLYTLKNKPSEANSKFKNYNEYAKNYNELREEVKKGRGKRVLQFFGGAAGAFLFIVGLDYLEGGDGGYKNHIEYTILGVAGNAVIMSSVGNHISPDRAIRQYNDAINEKKRLGFD